MPAFDPVSLGIQTGLGAAQSIVGLINSKKTKKEAEQLKRTRPKYDISPEAKKGLSLTESELATGMSAKAEKAYNDIADRQFSTSLDAILKSGGSSNNIADVYSGSQQGRQNLAIMKDQLRMNQIQNLLNQQRYMQEQEDKQWQVNVDAPWKDAAQANAAARKQSQAMIWGGLGQIAGGGMGAAGQIFESNKLNPSQASNLDNGGSVLAEQPYVLNGY